jgi:hypothetical protein
MATDLLACPTCGTEIPGTILGRGPAACPFCRTPLRIDVFPALFAGLPKGRSADPVVAEGEASCFYHPRKKAEVPCDSCGRFLCALCDLEIADGHFCPYCLAAYRDESVKWEGRNPLWTARLTERRIRYADIALVLGILPMLLCMPITIVTGPITVYLCNRHRMSPPSLFPSGRWRIGVALTAVFLQGLLWVAFIAGMLAGAFA